MKKLTMIFALMLMLATAFAAPVATVKDTLAVPVPTDEVEAFSDTTSVDTVAAGSSWSGEQDEEDEWEEEWNGSGRHGLWHVSYSLSDFGVDIDDLIGMVFALCVLSIIFLLAPVIIIGLILYFVYKNRKDKMRLMEAAIKDGRQIPLDVLGTPHPNTNILWDKGIKQIFLGAGLAILLWIVLGKLGLAIGALVALIGCGNVVIAHNAKERQKKQELYDKMFNKQNHGDESQQQ